MQQAARPLQQSCPAEGTKATERSKRCPSQRSKSGEEPVAASGGRAEEPRDEGDGANKYVWELEGNVVWRSQDDAETRAVCNDR